MIFRKVLHKIGIQRSYSKTVGTKKFKIPIYNKLGFANFSTGEPWMDEVLQNVGSKETKFLDIGANIGQTLMKWRGNFETAPYLGVEPNLQCAAYVDFLIKTNNIKAAEIIPVAVTDNTQFLDLYSSQTDPSDVCGTTVPNFREEQNQNGKKVVGLNYSLFRDYKPDIIKIDVEGAELNIIRSIFEAKNETSPTILCEILPCYNDENISRIKAQDELITILKKNQYCIFKIDTVNVKIKEISKIRIHGDLTQCEYIFVHKEHKSNLISSFN